MALVVTDALVWLTVWVGLVPLLLLAWIYRYSRSLESRKGVPKGSFWQLPIVGETIQFHSGSVDDYMLPRIARYGRTFRTTLLGAPAICTTTADVTKFVLQNPKYFKSEYTKSLREMFGSEVITLVEGEIHSLYRRLIHSHVLSDALKERVGKVDGVVRQFMQRWGDEATLHNTMSELQKLTFTLAWSIVCDDVTISPEQMEEFHHQFITLGSGLSAFPFLNIPGTVYSNAIKARDEVHKFLYGLIDQRRAEKGSVQHNDLLQSFLSWKGQTDEETLTDKQVAENLASILYAGHDTTATTLVWIIRDLLLRPDIMEKVKAEHVAVAKGRAHLQDPVSWNDLQNLPFTTQVIKESQRISSVPAFSMRTVREDVEYNGILFPKGWKVFTWYRYFHRDPEIYNDPLKFDPSRFESQPKPNTFTPFGNGVRTCPGMDFAKRAMFIFLHRLLISYDIEPVGSISDDVSYWPLICPKDGLPIKITRKSGSF